MLWFFVVCFGSPFAFGGAFLLLPNFNHIYMFGSASPPLSPPTPTDILHVCPEANDMVVCLGGGLPLLAFTHRRRYYGEASGAQLECCKKWGKCAQNNCDGACFVSFERVWPIFPCSHAVFVPRHAEWHRNCLNLRMSKMCSLQFFSCFF